MDFSDTSVQAAGAGEQAHRWGELCLKATSAKHNCSQGEALEINNPHKQGNLKPFKHRHLGNGSPFCSSGTGLTPVGIELARGVISKVDVSVLLLRASPLTRRVQYTSDSAPCIHH